ncbi:MAG: hypothetical protein L6Q98_01505 [Anaerolineae bacterium]|nr:hypothetical protein [Anaerolineae bacterium]NUQ04446.1 hypothetical protein [Anaerolineae bacterium]
MSEQTNRFDFRLAIWTALLLIAALAGACSVQQATPADSTALPPQDLTAEAARQALGSATAPPLEGTIISVETITRFDDMAAAAAEIAVDGDLLSTGAFPTGSASLIAFESVPGANPAEFPTRRLIFSIDVRDADGTDAGLLTVTLYAPENLTGAHTLTKAAAIMPDKFGVLVALADLEDDFLTLADPAGLALQGDIRVLENENAFTAAFDFTLTSGVTGQSVHVSGRVNGIPYVAQ